MKLTEPINPKLADELGTKYYTADIHRACFALPAFVRKVNFIQIKYNLQIILVSKSIF